MILTVEWVMSEQSRNDCCNIILRLQDDGSTITGLDDGGSREPISLVFDGVCDQASLNVHAMTSGREKEGGFASYSSSHFLEAREGDACRSNSNVDLCRIRQKQNRINNEPVETSHKFTIVQQHIHHIPSIIMKLHLIATVLLAIATRNAVSAKKLLCRRGSVEKGELKPGGARAVPEDARARGSAWYGLVAVGGWQTLWCRRGRTVAVGGSGSSGWVRCRSRSVECITRHRCQSLQHRLRADSNSGMGNEQTQ
eukprot:scaffold10125_cov108-Skeletonema_dohrnii-CCMP3373.AAC.1